MCIGIIWNNSFLVGGRTRAEARIDPRPLRTSRSTAHGAQVVWPLDYMGRAPSRSCIRAYTSTNWKRALVRTDYPNPLMQASYHDAANGSRDKTNFNEIPILQTWSCQFAAWAVVRSPRSLLYLRSSHTYEKWMRRPVSLFTVQF